MKQRKALGWLAVGAIVVALALGVIPVFAQVAAPSAVQNASLAHGGIGREGMCGQAALDAAAKALKMTTNELKAQLWGGQTLSGLADKAGVKLADVQSAVQAACQQAQKDAINQAVKDGKITQANADWLIEGIEKGYIGSMGGFGMDFGFGMELGGRGMMGGHRGFGGFGVPKGTAPNSGTTPNNGTTTPNSFQF